MSERQPEFDKLSQDYAELLRDPIRERFTTESSEFFHIRKRDLIRDYFRRRQVNTGTLRYLDLGCGMGELLSLLHNDFAHAAGCDPSQGMLEAGRLAAKGIETRVQTDMMRMPFDDRQFDFVTAVCVYHHVPVAQRDRLTAEARRVLKPGGVFAIIEHNPYNPATRLIVSRTPVDADAILLRAGETRGLMKRGGFGVDEQRYFLYFPQNLYGKIGGLETALRWVPMGGQYAVFARMK